MMRCSQFAVVVFVLVANVALSEDSERQTGERLRQLLDEASPKARAIAGHAEKSRAAYAALKNELSMVCQSDPADLAQDELAAIAEGCMLTHRFDDCAKYAQAAVSRMPCDESVNLLLIRSLVYLKQVDQAANALEFAKSRVPPTSKVRALHSIIYASAAASKEWDQSLPHIERHIDYLVEAAATHPRDAVQIHFWIDQLALAYRNTDADYPDRLLPWRERFDALSVYPHPPWKIGPLREQCAVLELRCAAEFHIGHGLVGTRLAEWADVIGTSSLLSSESEFAAETSFLCNFLRSHGHELHSKTRATVIAKLDEIEKSVFRIYPSRHVGQALDAVANARRSLLIPRKPQ